MPYLTNAQLQQSVLGACKPRYPEQLLQHAALRPALRPQVSPCAQCAAPSARVSGPATITQPCEQSGGGSLALGSALTEPPTFDASGSVEPSGRATWADVRWSIASGVAALVPADSVTLLQAAIDRTNALASPRDRLRLSLTAAEASGLTDSSAYGVTVTLTSWLGTSGSVTFPFARASTDSKPTVSVVGQAAQTFKITSGLSLSADAGAVCKGACACSQHACYPTPPVFRHCAACVLLRVCEERNANTMPRCTFLTLSDSSHPWPLRPPQAAPWTGCGPPPAAGPACPPTVCWASACSCPGPCPRCTAPPSPCASLAATWEVSGPPPLLSKPARPSASIVPNCFRAPMHCQLCGSLNYPPCRTLPYVPRRRRRRL